MMKREGFVTLGVLVVVGALAVGHLLMMSRVKRPAGSEFGLGPRTSASHLYTATLAPGQRLRPRTLQTVHVKLMDARGQAIDGAQISIDGGMPQHGHGLPTKPRVTKSFGDGVYEIDGVRFNMGGWWEFKLSISSASGTDVVTFNLDL
jgi:hypothetical protein